MTATSDIVLNGSPHPLPAGEITVESLLSSLDLAQQRVAVEVNGDVVPRDQHAVRPVKPGDRVEVVTFVGGGDPLADEPLRIGKHEFSSRLFVGTGKYASNEQTVAALEASGTECVTVALRRVDLKRTQGENLLDVLGGPVDVAAQHRRLFHRRGCRTHAALGARTGHRGLGEAGGAGRSRDAAAGHGSHVGGPQATGGRGLPCARLHQR